MASAATLPQQDQSKIGRPSGQEPQQPQTQEDPLMKFRELGQQVQRLQNQYPEMAEEAIMMLKAIQKAMTKVAGSAARNPDKQAPPVA